MKNFKHDNFNEKVRKKKLTKLAIKKQAMLCKDYFPSEDNC